MIKPWEGRLDLNSIEGAMLLEIAELRAALEPMTKGEIQTIIDDAVFDSSDQAFHDFARAIEAHHKIGERHDQ